jgi:hypothetical protein
MYVYQHTGQLSIEEFYTPFGGKLDPNNRWVLLRNPPSVSKEVRSV